MLRRERDWPRRELDWCRDSMSNLTLNPEVLRWARETAGLGVDVAASKLGLRDAKHATAEEQLDAIEGGQRPVTRSLVERMTKVYHRPLIAFFVAEPPAQGDRGQDFRTIPADRLRENQATVDALIRSIRARQSVIRAILEGDEDRRPLEFVGSVDLEDSVNAVVNSIMGRLRFDRQEFRRGNIGRSFMYLRSRVEELGVFVLLAGNLGSHHTNISADVFRGFALSDDLAPFVVINDQDARTAWSFTLLHELVHLWLGTTGISAGFPNVKIEKFCNDVASQILLPEEDIQQRPFGSEEEIVSYINTLAAASNTSRSLVLYRLFRKQFVTEAFWKITSEQFREEWHEKRESEKQKRSDLGAKPGGPDYYVVARHKLGNALTSFVKRSIEDGALTPTRAGMVLGVRPINVPALLDSRVA